ncbi:FRG domain-containing protein [Avibacterium paragallinarum]|uniref:FRG domain-containing protein n=1 Tax=Avibacterium paragallinarum TaxID=728 RepID=UPI0021F7676D|nr:FRG domain-containing protein [Avibacterium paragallinarum]UXN35459.1 FRG domain-containing protein [Avibacterium paragallinarum]
MKEEIFFTEKEINTLYDLKDYIKDIYCLLEKSPTDIPSDINIIDINNKIADSFFRGHSKESYELKSTLEREINAQNIINLTKEKYDEIQKSYLLKCKQLLRGKIPEQGLLLTDNFDDEIWAIGQHFGLKTPLLDWTYSFNIALFFAFKEPNKSSTNSDSEYRVIYHLRMPIIDTDRIKIFEPKFDVGGRINAQQGVFTKYLYSEFKNIIQDIYKSIPEHLDKNTLTKIKIKSSLRNKVISYLNEMNINNSTLFPDIAGAIMDCHLHLDNILEEEHLD